MVGRVRKISLLDWHLAARGPSVLQLTGEPGIGKSSLLAFAARRADAQGWCVLSGGSYRRCGQAPYAPILAALQSQLWRASGPRLGAHLRGCSWLICLLPELAAGPIEPIPTADLPLEQERRMMFDPVARFLANGGGQAGTLLLLDDL